ncbi:MAG: ankyrin repeat domain-containing protein [Candidatus Thermoplasmatota archaeon]|nr:ankyrin repeat domain-containing protein [Candidatus Thermoplasmatota archaeon]
MDFDLDDPLTAFATYFALDYLTSNDDNGEGSNDRDDNGVTPLMLAAAKGDVRRVRDLIAKGADVNARNKWGATALMYAVNHSGSVEVAKILIENGADVNARDNNGETALIDATDRGNREMVKLLLESGADVNARTNDGVTALTYATARRNRDLVRLLLENGADVDIKDEKGDTALDYASKNINMKDSRGKAVSYPVDKEIVDLLEKAQQEKAHG